MRTLRVGFSKNRKGAIFSRCLQKYMGKDYSHVFVEFNTKAHLGDDIIYHSSLSAGIGCMSKSIFEEGNTIVMMFELRLEDELYKKVRENLFKVCGRKYGMFQNIGIGVVDLCRKLGINISNPCVDDENCSELVYKHALRVAFPDMTKKYDPNLIKPSEVEDILLMLSSLGKARKVT